MGFIYRGGWLKILVILFFVVRKALSNAVYSNSRQKIQRFLLIRFWKRLSREELPVVKSAKFQTTGGNSGINSSLE